MIRSTISSWREYLTPISHKSTFLTTGEITPEEFTQAGDYLTHMFPTWRWNGSEDISNVNVRDFLPNEKQFLISRKVPCKVRADDFFNVNENDQDGIKFDEEDIEINDKVSKGKNDNKLEKTVGCNEKPEEIRRIDDIDELMQSMEIKDSEDVSDDDDDDGDDDEIIMKTDERKRYYDLYITYSTSYRVPKMYIVGFNAEGSPLTANEMFEDITIDYRSKTATIEKLPFYKNSMISVSIHPCKHANVMKILLEKVRLVKKNRREEEQMKQKSEGTPQQDANNDDWEDLQDDVNDTLQIDQYLVVFLKFITSITPTIEHDYTMEGW